jgi:hypothetical protein
MKYYYDQAANGGSREYVFDLSLDPAEKNNLAEQRPGELARLRAMVDRWIEEVKPER